MATKVRTQIPNELITVFKNGFNNHHRSLLLIVGPNGIMRMPYIANVISKIHTSPIKNILWCFQKNSSIPRNQSKKHKDITKYKNQGLYSEDTLSESQKFLTTNKIRYCKYQETDQILGQTYSMLILQDFTSMTPNVLARTVETVEGGGVIVIILDSLSSLEDFANAKMGFQASMNGQVKSRFNVRLLQSLSNCQNCVAINDEFTLLEAIKPKTSLAAPAPEKVPLQESHPVIEKCRTNDQASIVMASINNLKEFGTKIIGITASRGRGKSAALGLILAAAIDIGYTNVFVTAPDPSNTVAIFEFVGVGLTALGYRESADYVLNQKDNVTISVVVTKRKTRQTIQYIKPKKADFLKQCELLAIDEAAAIPLPVVQKLIGPYPVLFSSTVDGYEGTGRALSLKLFAEFRKSKNFTELHMGEPIRYSDNDPIEKWLHQLLCLENELPEIDPRTSVASTQLYAVNRDLLFSGDKRAEKILNSMVGLSVASHYKNEPDDLILMADDPNHELFVLVDPTVNKRAILAFIQISNEGGFDRSEIMDNTNRSKRPSGDLIPWTIQRHFSDSSFPQKKGFRVVRISVHSALQSKGYGTRAIELLLNWATHPTKGEAEPSLFIEPQYYKHRDFDYCGVSFGITEQLLRFWMKNGFNLVEVSQRPNKQTGEHSSIVLQAFTDINLPGYQVEFRRRFLKLLGREFSDMKPSLVTTILTPLNNLQTEPVDYWGYLTQYDLEQMNGFLTDKNFQRIEYCLNQMAHLVVAGQPSKFGLSRMELLALIYIGLQLHSVSEFQDVFDVNDSMFISMMVNIVKGIVDNQPKIEE